MKGMYLGRRFYRQMVGLVLLLPVVVVRGVAVPRHRAGRFPGFDLQRKVLTLVF